MNSVSFSLQHNEEGTVKYSFKPYFFVLLLKCYLYSAIGINASDTHDRSDVAPSSGHVTRDSVIESPLPNKPDSCRWLYV